MRTKFPLYRIFLKWNTATRLHSIKTYFKEFSVEKLWTAVQFSKSNYFLSCLITFFWNWQLQTVQHAFNWLKLWHVFIRREEPADQPTPVSTSIYRTILPVHWPSFETITYVMFWYCWPETAGKLLYAPTNVWIT